MKANCAECGRECHYDSGRGEKINRSKRGHIISKKLPNGQSEMVGDLYVIDYVLCQPCWKKREHTGQPMV